MYWNSLNDYLRRRYGRKVYKLAISSGCSCPNRDGTLGKRGCIFCDGAGAFAETGDIPEQLAAARRRVAAKAGPDPRFIAYFQSFTNTYAPVERLRRLLKELNRQKPVWVELGLQTIHPASAAYIRRGYDLPVFDQAVRRLKEAGITVVAHQILGLPGETEHMMAATARYIGASGADGIKFHLLHVLRGTDLARDWAAGRVACLEQEAYIAALESCLRNIPRNMVVHRLTGDGAKRDLLAL